jgi:hypothetical protein
MNSGSSGAAAVFGAAWLLMVAIPAYGYTDPGSGLLLWQMVGAAVVGSLFYVKRLLGWLSPGRRKSGKVDDES